MAEYIERESTLHRMKVDIRPPFAVVADMPAANVAPVVHGRWESICRGKIVVCSVCGSEFDNTCNYDIRKDWKGCPKCLSRMDLEISDGKT